MTNRTDANQAEIVAALRSVGCDVIDLHLLGRGVPDLAVFSPHLRCEHCRGHWVLMEVKAHEGRLTPDQVVWRLKHDSPTEVVRSVDDALRVCGVEIGG
jgi:hypothetical protein